MPYGLVVVHDEDHLVHDVAKQRQHAHGAAAGD
jgi:hypothetical protein